MPFSTIPVRTKGIPVDVSWWNALRAAGAAIELFLGAAFKQETTQSVANTQAATNVTGLSFDSTAVKSAIVPISVRRKTDSAENVATGFLHVHYKNLTSTWDLIPALPGDETGVTFTITAGGQIQYASDTLAGANYVGALTYKAITFAT